MSGSSRRAFLARSLALGVAAPSLASLVAACSGDEGGGPGDKSTQPRPADPTRRFTGKVVVATLQNPPVEARRALSEAYRKHQPGVEIVWDTKDHGTTGAYATWLGGQLTGSRIGPDIVSGNFAPAFRSYVNLDEYRAQINPYTGRPWDQDYAFSLYRDLNARGERTVVGTEGVHLLWYYNKDVFAQVGIEPPKTWNEVIAVSRKLKAARQIPLVANFDYIVPQWFSSIYFDQFHSGWSNSVRAQPGDWNWDPELDDSFEFDAENPRLHASYTFSQQRFFRGLKEKTLRYDTPAMVEIITNFTKVFPQFSTTDFFARTDQYTPFLQGKAAMMVDGAWSLPLLRQDLEGIPLKRLQKLGIAEASVKPFEWDVFEFPPMRGPLVQADVRVPEGTTGNYLCAIDKNADRTEMVMDFFMFWISKAGYSAYSQGLADAKSLPPRGPAMVKGIQYPKEVQDLFDKVEQKGVLGPAYGDFWVNGVGGPTGKGLKDLFVSALQRKLDPQEYATKLQKYVTLNYPQMLRTVGLSDADIETPARRPRSV